MDPARAATWGTVSLIVAVTLVSGPLVGAVDFTADERPPLGSGNATITDVSAPDTVRIERGEYGSETYYLRVPAVTVDIASVEGRPILSYALSIPSMSYTRESVHFLDSGTTGRTRVSIAPDEFEPGSLTPGTYGGELRLTLRADGNSTVVYRDEVTVEIEE